MKQHGNSRVRPSVGPIHPLQRSAAGALLGATREVGDINRLQQAPGGWHEMRAVSRLQVPQKLNTDLLNSVVANRHVPPLAQR